MPHRGVSKGFGKLAQVSVRRLFLRTPVLGTPAMITAKEFRDGATVSLVIISGGLAGHYAAIGMTPVQWAGAVAAVLGSVTLAVAVRVWPLPQKAKAPQRQRD
jgi:hypothetical protein